MGIRWTVPAADDLESIRHHLQQSFPPYAEPIVRTIYERVRSIETAPSKGRPGRRSGTRELPLTPLPYVVVYSLGPEAIEILHIHHGSRD